jgi:hypothetical protein
LFDGNPHTGMVRKKAWDRRDNVNGVIVSFMLNTSSDISNKYILLCDLEFVCTTLIR